MKKIVNEKYQASNGRIFNDKEECQQYEERYVRSPAIAKFRKLTDEQQKNYNIIKKHYEQFCELYQRCNFSWSDGVPPVSNEFIAGWHAAIKFLEKNNKSYE